MTAHGRHLHLKVSADSGHPMRPWVSDRSLPPRDFSLATPHGSVIVEAVTANSADGATPEGEKMKLLTDQVRRKDFWPQNREAIIRMSNSLLSKDLTPPKRFRVYLG